MDENFWIQRLAGECRRAVIDTATAFRAGIRIEQVLPGKLINLLHSVDIALRELLTGLRINLLQASEETVGNRCQDVHMLAVGQVVEKGEKHDGMDPPEDICRNFQRSGRHTTQNSCTYEGGNRHIAGRFLDALRYLGAVRAEEGYHQGNNESQDHKGVSAPRIDI